MQDIAKIGLKSINYNTMHRQVAEDDSSESPSQTEGGKCEQFKGERQEAETKSTQDADNTPKPPIVTNPMVMGNNNNDLTADLIADTRNDGSTDFLSELLSNHSLVSDEVRKNDMMTKNTQSNCNSIDFMSEPLINQSFVSDEEKKR